MCNLEENVLFSTLILGSVFSDYVVFYWDTKEKERGVRVEQSGETKEEEVMGKGIGELEIEELVPE